MRNNSKNYILWGSAGHAKVLADIIKLKGAQVIAIFDNNQDVKSCLPGVPLFHQMAGFKKWLKQIPEKGNLCAAIAIGGNKGEDRQEIMSQMKAAGLQVPFLLHPAATVSESAQIGEGCQVLAHGVIAADVSMGSVCIVNNSANVDHECTLGNGVHIAPGAVLCGCVEVGENTMIGAGAVVLPRISIGKRAFVGAGSIVTRNVPDGAVVVGNPAKIK